MRSPVGVGAGSGPVVDGLFLLPVALGQLVAGSGTTALTRAVGDRWAFIVGLVLAAAGSVLLALAPSSLAAS